MKKVFLIVAAILLFTGATAFGLVYLSGTVNSGPTASVKSFDLVKSTNQANIALQCYSSRVRVKGRVNGSTGLVVLASYSSTGKKQFVYNLTTPYRYVYICQTTLLGGGASATVSHSTPIDIFTW